MNKKNSINSDEKKEELIAEILILRPNFSTDPLDQFDIVKHFESNPAWIKFIPILTREMETQNSSDVLPEPPEQLSQPSNGLDALLDDLLGSSNVTENANEDSDSDSDSEDQ